MSQINQQSQSIEEDHQHQTSYTHENTMSLNIHNILLEHLDFEENEVSNGELDELVNGLRAILEDMAHSTIQVQQS